MFKRKKDPKKILENLAKEVRKLAKEDGVRVVFFCEKDDYGVSLVNGSGGDLSRMLIRAIEKDSQIGELIQSVSLRMAEKDLKSMGVDTSELRKSIDLSNLKEKFIPESVKDAGKGLNDLSEKDIDNIVDDMIKKMNEGK